MTACELLRSEHRLVETELDVLLQLAKHPDGQLVSGVRRALRRIRCLSDLHFRKEEEIFYPFLQARFPELLAQMVEQHQDIHEVESHLSELVSSGETPTSRQRDEVVSFATQYYDLLQHHIVNEEEQLLRFADAHLSSQEQAALAQRMQAMDPVICAP